MDCLNSLQKTSEEVTKREKLIVELTDKANSLEEIKNKAIVKANQLRKQLDNLKLIIIDEISLVKSDLLYQLDFRLQKDIFQNCLTFGGLAVIVFGDILQIRPPSARHVFLSPQNPRLQLLHEVDNLWRKFKVVILKTFGFLNNTLYIPLSFALVQ